MDEIEVAEHRMRVHPAFTGGPADEGYWLDSLQWALKSIGTYESMVEPEPVNDFETPTVSIY